MNVIAKGLALAVMILSTANSNAKEDPRMNRDAVLMATICADKGCREVRVLGPYVDEFYGKVGEEIHQQRKMNVRFCNGFLSSGGIAVMVQRWLYEHIGPRERIVKLYCDLSHELSI